SAERRERATGSRSALRDSCYVFSPVSASSREFIGGTCAPTSKGCAGTSSARNPYPTAHDSQGNADVRKITPSLRLTFAAFGAIQGTPLTRQLVRTSADQHDRPNRLRSAP